MGSNVLLAALQPRPFFPSVAEEPTHGHEAPVPVQLINLDEAEKDFVPRRLLAFDLCEPAYWSPAKDGGWAGIPDRPLNFSGPHLLPTLAKHERERVTALWYYTRGIHADHTFLKHLQGFADFVQILTERDYAVIGLLDLDVYSQIAASEGPLMFASRQRTICSHTILQEPGTLLMVPDTKSDWRFAELSFVKQGVASYVGAPLHYRIAEDGPDIMFGSLCVLSGTIQPPLTSVQQLALTRFSDIIVHSIVERARAVRTAERHKMLVTLAQVAAAASADNVMQLVLDALRRTYPHAAVSVQERPNGSISLHPNRDIPYENFLNHLWEDVEAIDKFILNSNHVPWVSDSTSLRAIAVKRAAIPDTYIVVQGTHLKHVFDNIDSSFVQSCALLIGNIEQAHRLEETLAARTRFLRGATHQLRTPIHGILSTCELLLDQLQSQLHALGSGKSLNGFTHNEDTADMLENATTTLNLIDVSARNLLSTVNNLLNFDQLSSVRPVPQLVSLLALEDEVLDQVASGAAEREVTLVCDNQLPPDVHLLNVDLDLIKQCLGALLQNAVHYTHSGSVLLRTSIETGYTALVYDVIDTGQGIPLEDHRRIFLPLQKCDALSTGQGLGLSVAATLASRLDGAVTLVTSSGRGSHFRLRLEHPVLACSRHHVFGRLRTARMPQTFRLCVEDTQESRPVVYAARQLERIGFVRTTEEFAPAVLVETPMTSASIDAALCSVPAPQLILYLCRSDAEAADVQAHALQLDIARRAVTVSTPLCRAKLWRAIESLLNAYDVMHPPRLGEAANITPSRCVHPLASGPQRRMAALRILIVDDNRTNLDILCMNARRRRFPYLTAMDGAQAVDVFETCLRERDDTLTRRPVSLILMDLQMPGTDGIEATALIRQCEATNNLSPCLIYMVTGQSSDEDKRRSIDAGADGYFVKPLSLRALNDLIRSHFPSS